MKRFSFIVGFFLLFSSFQVFAQTYSYPEGAPSGEVEGGYFKLYFDNLFHEDHRCPEGQVIVGFMWNGGVPTGVGDITGKPICKNANGEGLALGFTGAMVGSGGSIPVYNSTGTGLINSWLSQ